VQDNPRKADHRDMTGMKMQELGISCYLDTIMSKKAFGICHSGEIQDGCFVPTACFSHQEGIGSVFTV